jgi:hypothetical protein
LEAKENLGLDIFMFWWIKATIMEEIAQCINNNITTIVAHPTPGRSKESYSTRIFGSSISVQQSDDTYTCPQGEILKPRKMAQESGRTEQSGYQFKKYRTPACKLSSKPFITSRTSRSRNDRTSMRKALKITNAIKKTRNYTERDKR